MVLALDVSLYDAHQHSVVKVLLTMNHDSSRVSPTPAVSAFLSDRDLYLRDTMDASNVIYR